MKYFWILCILLGLTAVPVQAQAETPIFIDNHITPDFPETITFHLSLDTNETEIKRVLLRYGTNGRSCQDGGSLQSVKFEPDKVVETEWEWELRRSGAIPPGALVWWQWEIQDTDGNITTSKRQEYVVADDNHQWQSIDRNGIAINWYDASSSFGEAMYTQTENSLNHLQTNLGLPQPENVQLWFYDSGSAVQDALVNVPEWTGGVAFPEYGITVLGVAPGQDEWAAHIVPHELTHLLEGILTFNCRGIRLPTWLSEGLARYAEGDVDTEALARLETALAKENLPSLKSLSAGFSAYSDGAGLAYTYSGQIVAYLMDTYGPEQMTVLLQTMQAGSDIDAALQTVYGFDTYGLDAVWRTEQGYAPTPTSAADAAALAASATPVPTIALGGIPQANTATPPMTPAVTAVPSTTPSPQATIQATATIMPTNVIEEVASPGTPTNPSDETEPETQPSKQTPFNWIWLLFIVGSVSVFVVIVWQYKKRKG